MSIRDFERYLISKGRFIMSGMAIVNKYIAYNDAVILTYSFN